MKNNLVIILSHCNTEEKKELLEDNIKKLKSNNFDILLLSHIPIPPNIQESIEYFIYDKSNPIINWPERGMVFWKKILGDINYRLQTIYPDYGWTAFNQILLGGNLGLSLSYDYFSFINYDIQLTDSIIEALDNPVPFLTSTVQPAYESKPRYPSFMLNILNRKNLKSILPIIDKKHYMCDTHSFKKDGKFQSAENYWEHLVTNFSHTIYPENIMDLINFDNFSSMFNYSNTDKFKMFFQNNNTHPTIKNSGVPGVLVYDINISNLKLIVNDQYTFIEKGKNELIDLPEVKKIGFIVDNEYIDFTEKYNESIYQKIDLVE